MVEHHSAVVTLLEGLDHEQRKSLTVDLGFLPDPSPLETFVGMRLNETSAHAWDVRVAFDPDAGIEAAVRMLSGRLRPDHTPADVEVTGSVTLDDLRPVFPGY